MLSFSRRLSCLALALVLCLSFAACAGEGTEPESGTAAVTQTAETSGYDTAAPASEAQTHAMTEARTEAFSAVPTEIPTEVVTEAPTEVLTEVLTEVPTDIPTDIPTDTPAEPATEPPTVPATEAPTDPPTEPQTEPETEPETAPAVKNIIFLIPDGAGFGTYDMANALKTATGSGVYGQKTPVTRDAIAGRTVKGLYLDEFMIASADTSLATDYNGYPTDSAAAGTALLGGYKTNYLMVGVGSDYKPHANLLELCRLAGKSTGFVTTKCLVDATPTAALAHSLKRADQDSCAYQYEISRQILNSGVDVLLAYGTDGGYVTNKGTVLHYDRAGNHGYRVVSDLASLNRAVYGDRVTRLFSDFHNPDGMYYPDYRGTWDYQGFHIPYDCDAGADDLTLMDMAKAALTLLSENIDNPEGFCLVIEGGAIDNAAEGRNVREAVGEYLAFDEVFGYCVNWAMERGDTVVVACPDHDSGGFYRPDNLDAVVAGLSDGSIGNGTVLPGAVTGHSPQNVPVWLWAPEPVYTDVLTALGLPVGSTGSVRTGRFYDGSRFNPKYVIKNSDISPAVVSVLGLPTFAEATDRLFVNANSLGSYNPDTRTFTFKNGERVTSGTAAWVDTEGRTHYFSEGFAFWLTNPAKYTVNRTAAKNTFPNVFYMPREVLAEMGY